MTTIYIRFKSLFMFALIILCLSFVWFSITSLQQEKQVAQTNNHQRNEIESALKQGTKEGEKVEAHTESTTKPVITLLPENNSGLVGKEENFFSEYRLERERTLSEQREILNEIINNHNSSAQIRTDAQQKLLGLTENLGRESKIENALVAKGFSEAIAVIQNPAVLVIVPSEGFRQDEIARIADIVTKIAECRWEDVVIVPKTR